MLQTLHRFRLVFLVILVLSSVALAFSGFAYSWLSPNRERQAIEIDDSGVSFRDLENERKELDQMYRQQFGPNYFRILEQLNVNLQEQVVDRAIQNALITREAERIGFAASTKSVADQLAAEFGSLPNPREQYSQFLLSIGMSSQEFEERIRRGIIRSQLEQIVRDSALASDREVRASLTLEKTKYSVSYVALRGDDFLSEARAPTDDAIQEYYEENASDFELPARVSYVFTPLDPAKFQDIVEVYPDDVELYYTDHESDFTTPERRSVRLIRVAAAKDAVSKPSTAKESMTAKEGSSESSPEAPPSAAASLLKELEGGADFATLAKKSSTDDSATNGGLLGTFTQTELAAKLNPDTAKKIFALEKNKPLLESAGEQVASDIFIVDEITPATTKSLEEVRPTIEQAIRAREAPAFVAAKGEELLEDWRKSGLPLAQFLESDAIKERALSTQSSADFSAEGVDPVGFSGLTARVLDQVDDKKFLIDLGEHTILAEVRDYKGPEIEPIEAVRSRIIEVLKRRDAASKARELAQLIQSEMTSGKYPSLKAAADASGQKLLTATDMTRENAPAPFDQSELKRAVFSETSAPSKTTSVQGKDGAHYLIQVSSISLPGSEEIEKDMAGEREQEANSLSGVILASLLNDLKASARIDVSPGVLTGN